MFYLFVFILGLIFGSFANAILWRYQKKISLKGRSMCTNCKHRIPWYDNIPILSWLLLSGRCRFCKKPISIDYPLVELITGGVFLMVTLYSKEGILITQYLAEPFLGFEKPLFFALISLVAFLAVIFCLILISVYDLRFKEIPNGFNLIHVFLSVSYLFISGFINKQPPYYYIQHFLAGFVVFAIFYALVIFTHETWMGGGDAKLTFGMGLVLGPIGVFLAVMLASILGSIYGLGVIFLTKNKKIKKIGLKTEIPFGPFLVLGTVITLLFGVQIINGYVKLMIGF